MATVKAYALQWSISSNKGAVNLQVQSGIQVTQVQIPVDSAAELAALADILRETHDVAFDVNGQVLSTTFKTPGSA